MGAQTLRQIKHLTLVGEGMSFPLVGLTCQQCFPTMGNGLLMGPGEDEER